MPESEDETHDDPTKVGNDADGGAGGGGGHQPDGDGLSERMDSLEAKLDSVLERLTGQPDPDASTARPGTQRAAEDDMEAKVASALGKIQAREDTKKRLEEIEAKLPKEEPPVKQRRSTRLVWGRQQ